MIFIKVCGLMVLIAVCLLAETYSVLQEDRSEQLVRWSCWLSYDTLLVSVFSCCIEMSRWCYGCLVCASTGVMCTEHATLYLSHDDDLT